MKINGYTHCDLHGQNIGAIFVNRDKKIDILGYKFPTFGIQYKALDFGMVLSDEYKLNDEDKKMYNFYLEEELSRVIRRIVVYRNGKLLTLENIPENVINEIEQDKLFRKVDQTISLEEQIILFQLLYPTEFQKIYLGNKYIKTNYPTLYLDLEDFIYLYLNRNQPINIINFCYGKFSNLK